MVSAPRQAGLRLKTQTLPAVRQAHEPITSPQVNRRLLNSLQVNCRLVISRGLDRVSAVSRVSDTVGEPWKPLVAPTAAGTYKPSISLVGI